MEMEAEKLQKAIELYQGEFLSILGAMEWVAYFAMHYKELYFKAVSRLCEIYMHEREYEKVLRVASYAAHIYPFD